MLIFSIIIYTLFGGMCIWFVISGIGKIKEIRSSQDLAAKAKEEESDKAADEAEPTNE